MRRARNTMPLANGAERDAERERERERRRAQDEEEQREREAQAWWDAFYLTNALDRRND